MPSRFTAKGVSLLELLVSMALFAVVSVVTLLAYNHARQTIFRSSARMDSVQRQRKAMQRVCSVLSSAYVPPINGVTSTVERPNLPYPSGLNAADPLSSLGPGCDSIMFYAPCDLIAAGAKLHPVAARVDSSYSEVGPKLYEIRLELAYQTDLEATYQVDQAAVPGTAPLVFRQLILREMYIPDHSGPYASIAYMNPPAGSGGSPQPSLAPLANTPSTILAQRLSDCRFSIAPGGSGFKIRVSSQDREATLNSQRPKINKTTSFSSFLYYPAGH